MSSAKSVWLLFAVAAIGSPILGVGSERVALVTASPTTARVGNARATGQPVVGNMTRKLLVIRK